MRVTIPITFEIETSNDSPEFMKCLRQKIRGDIHYDVKGACVGNDKHRGGGYSIQSLDVLKEEYADGTL